MTTKIKTFEHEDKTYAVLKDGKPIYIDDDGKELTYDPVAMHTNISRLNNESKTHREAKEDLEKTVKKFKDIDPVKARKALDIVKNLDDKKLIDAGEVERVIKEKTIIFQTQLDEAKAETKTLQTKYDTEKINSAFGASEYIKDKLAVPSDMAQATFGHHFVFKDGVMTPVDASGNTIYSDENPGEDATFDEAMAKIVKAYPHRDSILKGSGHQGSGTKPIDESGKRTVTRKQLEAMSPEEQQKTATSKDIKIVD